MFDLSGESDVSSLEASPWLSSTPAVDAIGRLIHPSTERQHAQLQASSAALDIRESIPQRPLLPHPPSRDARMLHELHCMARHITPDPQAPAASLVAAGLSPASAPRARSRDERTAPLVRVLPNAVPCGGALLLHRPPGARRGTCAGAREGEARRREGRGLRPAPADSGPSPAGSGRLRAVSGPGSPDRGLRTGVSGPGLGFR